MSDSNKAEFISSYGDYLKCVAHEQAEFAFIGRSNVGKSSLLNALAGEERSIVSDVAGTTRDPVDELITFGGSTWRFIDTAGLT